MVRRGRGVPAVFLDRDGVLTVPTIRDGRSFAPRTLEEFALYPDAAGATARLKQAGFLLIVVTNQPDVGRGLISREVVEEMHRRMAATLPLDAIEVCCHAQDGECDCRKPKPGMLRRAADRLHIDLSCSFMVGDRNRDVEAGRAAGCTTVFIDLDYAETKPIQPDFTVSSLAEAVDIILREGGSLSGRIG